MNNLDRVSPWATFRDAFLIQVLCGIIGILAGWIGADQKQIVEHRGEWFATGQLIGLGFLTYYGGLFIGLVIAGVFQKSYADVRARHIRGVAFWFFIFSVIFSAVAVFLSPIPDGMTQVQYLGRNVGSVVGGSIGPLGAFILFPIFAVPIAAKISKPADDPRGDNQ